MSGDRGTVQERKRWMREARREEMLLKGSSWYKLNQGIGVCLLGFLHVIYSVICSSCSRILSQQPSSFLFSCDGGVMGFQQIPGILSIEGLDLYCRCLVLLCKECVFDITVSGLEPVMLSIFGQHLNTKTRSALIRAH